MAGGKEKNEEMKIPELRPSLLSASEGKSLTFESEKEKSVSVLRKR